MKYIVIGLGSFGSSLAVKLTAAGNEVMGVDISVNRIETLKEKITHAVSIDCTDPVMAKELPIKDTDVVVVCIGEDKGANIMATAIMKQLKAKKVISRAVSETHQTILETMGVDEIINPEEEAAERWAEKLSIKGVLESFHLTGAYNIVEINVPKPFVGKNLEEVDLVEKFNIIALTTFLKRETTNFLGYSKESIVVQGIATKQTVLKEGEILVIYGHTRDIKRLLEETGAVS